MFYQPLIVFQITILFSFLISTTGHTQPLKAESPQEIPIYFHKQTQSYTIGDLQTEFPKDYISARSRFTDYGARLVSKYNGATKILTAALPSHPHLSIDGLYIQGQDPSRLFIITSGIHGAEAFTGSTLQDLFIKYLLKQNSLPFSVLILHGLNPYGFHHFRRVNPYNVDLNRNHVTPEESASENPFYDLLSPLLMPESPASMGILPQIGFYLGVAIKYLRHGKRTLLNSLSGQYKEPKGLFFGGTHLQHESVIVQNWIKEYSEDKTHIVHIDIHTGFGKKGELHFYGSDEFTSSDQLKALKLIFPHATIDTGASADFYPTHGDFIDWTWKSQAAKIVVPMVFEFGTLDSHTLKGGLRSLWTLALENQGYHHGYVSRSDYRRIRRQMEALFNPQEKAWQKKVLESGHKEIVNAYQKLKHLNSPDQK